MGLNNNLYQRTVFFGALITLFSTCTTEDYTKLTLVSLYVSLYLFQERREAKAAEGTDKTEKQKKICGNMLWQTLQFAFRVYSFAGGVDDRAEKLTRELAHELQTDVELHAQPL